MAAFRAALLWLLSCGVAAAQQLYPLPPYQPTGTVTGPTTTPTVLNDLMAWGNTTGTSAIDTGIPMGSIVMGPGPTTVNHIAVWGNTLGTKLIDGGGIVTPGPAVGSCAAPQYVVAYTMPGAVLTCRQPVTADLADINTFLALQVDQFGILTVPAVQPGYIRNPLAGLGATPSTSGGPLGSHSTVQVWFEIRDQNGVLRYVPGF